MERRIPILAWLVFIVYVENVSSSCVSSRMQAALSNTKTFAQRMNSYLDKCDSDHDLKKPMKLLGRHTEQVIKNIELINIILQSKCVIHQLKAAIILCTMN